MSKYLGLHTKEEQRKALHLAREVFKTGMDNVHECSHYYFALGYLQSIVDLANVEDPVAEDLKTEVSDLMYELLQAKGRS